MLIVLLKKTFCVRVKINIDLGSEMKNILYVLLALASVNALSKIKLEDWVIKAQKKGRGKG